MPRGRAGRRGHRGTVTSRRSSRSAEASADAPAQGAALPARGAHRASASRRGDVEGLLAQAYSADPRDKQAAALFEQLLVEEDARRRSLETQRRILAAIDGADARATRRSASARAG